MNAQLTTIPTTSLLYTFLYAKYKGSRNDKEKKARKYKKLIAVSFS